MLSLYRIVLRVLDIYYLMNPSNQQLQISESLRSWNIDEKTNSLKLFNILEML